MHDIVVNSLHPAAHAISLVPEPGSARASKKVRPPLAMRRRSRPCFERCKVLPVPAHSHVKGEKAIDDVLLAVKEPLGQSITRRLDLWAKTKKRLHSGERVRAHPQIDNDKVRILAEVDGLPIDACLHC